MLSLLSPPHLHTLLPSPTTAEFTVSTLLPLPQPQHTIRSIAIWTLRILVLTSSFLLLQAKYLHHHSLISSSSSPSSSPSLFSFLTFPGRLALPFTALFFKTGGEAKSNLPTFLSTFLTYLASSWAGTWAAKVAAPTPAWLLVPLCGGAAYLSLLRYYRTEKLLVLRGLGIQTWSAAPTVIGGPTTRFIPTAKVRDVLVNEAFLGYEVKFYLMVVVEGEDDLVVVFRGILPERDIVLDVWNGVRRCLWEGGKNPKWAARVGGG